jgi:hypothetical protein
MMEQAGKFYIEDDWPAAKANGGTRERLVPLMATMMLHLVVTQHNTDRLRKRINAVRKTDAADAPSPGADQQR